MRKIALLLITALMFTNLSAIGLRQAYATEIEKSLPVELESEETDIALGGDDGDMNESIVEPETKQDDEDITEEADNLEEKEAELEEEIAKFDEPIVPANGSYFEVSNFQELMQAVNSVTDGGTIKLMDDIYLINREINIIRNIEFTLDGNGFFIYSVKHAGDGDTENYRTFNIGKVATGIYEPAVVTMTWKNVIISHPSSDDSVFDTFGRQASGGGVHVHPGSSLTLIGDGKSKISGENSTATFFYFGGAIRVEDANAVDISGITIEQTRSLMHGGIRIEDTSDVTLKDLIITGNTTTAINNISYGGGMSITNSTVTIDNCTFSDNAPTSYREAYGGGVAIYNNSDVTITNSHFIGNEVISTTSAGASGGGIYVERSRVTVKDCGFEDNHASSASGISYGGGIYAFDLADEHNFSLITNSTFDNCTTNGIGGGIALRYVTQTFVHMSDLEIINCQAQNGGGIYTSRHIVESSDNPSKMERLTLRNNVATAGYVNVLSAKDVELFANLLLAEVHMSLFKITDVDTDFEEKVIPMYYVNDNDELTLLKDNTDIHSSSWAYNNYDCAYIHNIIDVTYNPGEYGAVLGETGDFKDPNRYGTGDYASAEIEATVVLRAPTETLDSEQFFTILPAYEDSRTFANWQLSNSTEDITTSTIKTNNNITLTPYTPLNEYEVTLNAFNDNNNGKFDVAKIRHLLDGETQFKIKEGYDEDTIVLLVDHGFSLTTSMLQESMAAMFEDNTDSNGETLYFTGWYTQDGSAPTNFSNITGNIESWAKWESNPNGYYRVHFDETYGGTLTSILVPMNDPTTLGSEYYPFPDPTATGYDFLGWYAEKDGKKEEVLENTPIDGFADNNRNIYLHTEWKPKIYDIIIDNTGAPAGNKAYFDRDPDKIVIENATIETLVDVYFTLEDGYFRDIRLEEYTGVYNRAEIKDAVTQVDFIRLTNVYNDGKNITVIPSFVRRSYTVFFNDIEIPQTLTVLHGESVNEAAENTFGFTVPAAELENWRHVGWSEDASTELFKMDQPIYEDTYLYPVFKPVYTVNFDVNGGVAAGGEGLQSVSKISTDTEKVELYGGSALMREGYTLAGWSCSTASHDFNAGAEYVISAFWDNLPEEPATTTLYAIWAEISEEPVVPEKPIVPVEPVEPEEPIVPVEPEDPPKTGNSGHGRPSSNANEEKEVPEKEEDEPFLLNTDDHYAYVVGYPNGEVRPQANITREETATIFFRLLTDETREEYFIKTNSFSDMGSERWSNTAVSTMQNIDIITGYADGTFRPEDFITRAEAAVVIANFNNSSTGTTTVFSDTKGHWAESYINRAVSLGWISGYEDGTFRPEAYITRAEIMTLINQVLSRNPQSYENLLDDMVTWSDNMDILAWYYLQIQEATNSHFYVRDEQGYEIWTEIRPVRDWALLEQGR